MTDPTATLAEVDSESVSSEAEVEIKARQKVFVWSKPIVFYAEDGGTCHSLMNAQITLLQYEQPKTCQALFDFRRNPGGRKGTFQCVIDLVGDNNATLEHMRFGPVSMPCGNSDDVHLGPISLPYELFGLARKCTFPKTSEYGVQAC